jgi:hypothetical protein
MTGIRSAATWASLGAISVLLALASLAGALPF